MQPRRARRRLFHHRRVLFREATPLRNERVELAVAEIAGRCAELRLIVDAWRRLRCIGAPEAGKRGIRRQAGQFAGDDGLRNAGGDRGRGDLALEELAELRKSAPIWWCEQPVGTGGWYDALPLGKHSLAKHPPSVEAQDVAKQKKLWELSEKLVRA